jgi:hypothetical protein
MSNLSKPLHLPTRADRRVAMLVKLFRFLDVGTALTPP